MLKGIILGWNNFSWAGLFPEVIKGLFIGIGVDSRQSDGEIINENENSWGMAEILCTPLLIALKNEWWLHTAAAIERSERKSKKGGQVEATKR